MAPLTICVFPPRSGPCWAFVCKFSHCFERMTNGTFHNFDVCPRCLAANPSLQVFVCLNNWCKDTSIHLLFKHSSINKRCLYRCTSSCHAALVTSCRRKEETRDIELADEYNAPGHLRPDNLTPTSSVVSNSELLTRDVDNSHTAQGCEIAWSFKDILFLLYLFKRSCSCSSKVHPINQIKISFVYCGQSISSPASGSKST